MSFYTSLTGLNSATKQLAVTSNNIANVGTSGFKRSRADFGDIFSTSPLQKSSAAIGQGVSLKQVSQEFSQGNVSTSGNSLDLAITGDGFFPLKSADGLQDIYTRNGAFSLNDQNNVVNSTGQRLQAASVDSSGKADLSNLAALTIPPKTSGEAVETTSIQLGLNLPAESAVILDAFDRTDPTTYNKSTALTVYDSGGNGYLATVYYVKTQNASQASPESKWQSYFFIGDTEVTADLMQARATDNSLYYVNKYGEVRSAAETDASGVKIVTPPSGKTEMYTLDELTDKRTSTPATAVGAAVADLTVITDGLALNSSSNPIAFTLNVDGMTTPLTVSYPPQVWDTGTSAWVDQDETYTDPATLASHLEIAINNALGNVNNLVGVENSAGATYTNNALTAATDARYGVSVDFDSDTGIFSIMSGSTGDASSIEIAPAGGAFAGSLAETVLGFTDASTLLAVDVSPTEAVRGQTSDPAVLMGEVMTINTANEVSVTSSNNTFYVSVDGIAGNITVAAGSYTMESLASQIQNKINAMSDSAGRETHGVTVSFDSTAKKLTFTTATTGELASLQVSGHADWGLDNTEIQFGTTSTWIKLAQHTENGALQYVKNGVQLEDSAELATGTEWWPVFLDRGELSFDLTGKPVSPIIEMPYETAFLDGGKGALTLAIDFTASTQYSSPFAVLSQSQDGAPEGELMGLDIGVDGLVSATYSNGSQNSLGKIVLANFSSPTGLRQIGDATYLSSATSGLAKIGEAGSAGYGSIRAGATERSNVDLTQELVDLITAQRNFQANSKAIETSSTMTQAIINIRS